VAVGETFTVSRILSQDPEVLAYVTELGVHPGSRLRVQAKEPVGELVTVALGDETLSISRELARLILGGVDPV
jgi:Fe2+ transport system protein FeoA